MIQGLLDLRRENCASMPYPPATLIPLLRTHSPTLTCMNPHCAIVSPLTTILSIPNQLNLLVRILFQQKYMVSILTYVILL